MTKLTYYDAGYVEDLVRPDEILVITKYSCAMEVFTSFDKFKPRIIDASISAIDADRQMICTGEQMIFVVDNDNYVIGVINSDNLNDREISKKALDETVREQIPVTDFIQPKFRIKAIDYFELEIITIDNVIQALTESGHRYCLVIDREQGIVRGVISASDIIKRLE